MKNGHTLVEFVLLFPLVVLLTGGLFSLGMLAHERVVLRDEAARLARALSLPPLSESDDVTAAAAVWLQRRWSRPPDVSIQIIALPPAALTDSRQAPRLLDVIEVRLERRGATATARELRVRTEALRE